MLKKSIVRLAIAMSTIFILIVCFSAYSIWSYSYKNELVKTDTAIVLGAAVWDNEPSPVFRERINHAIWLYENDYVGKIIFTGGKGEGDAYTEAEVARTYAIEHNVALEDIFIETKSKITEENLKYANAIAIENELNTCTIVSDPLHMKRAMIMAEDIGMKAYTSPTQSTVYQSLKTKVPFFLRELFFYMGYVITAPFR